MSQKQNLKEIYIKLKEAADRNPENTTLHEYLKELDAEITAMAERASDEEGGSGGNNPSHKPGTP